jgi:hypothetical protein
MSRVLFALVVAVSAVSCKGGAEEAAKVASNGSGAGKVLEVAGKVTVNGKPIAVGDQLQADDVVETGDDGRVVIELSHNLAHWELGGNKKQKVSESIAWKLPRSEGNSHVTIQDMSAAGRPAERNAANSAASAPAMESAPAPTTAAPAPPPAPTAPPALAQGGGSPPPSPMPPPKPDVRRGAESAKATPPPDLQPAPDPKTAPKGGKPTVGAASDIIGGRDGALRACLPAGAKVTIHVAIDATGKATTTVDDAPDDKVRSCIKAVISKLSLPAEKTTVNVTIEKSN